MEAEKFMGYVGPGSGTPGQTQGPGCLLPKGVQAMMYQLEFSLHPQSLSLISAPVRTC